MTVSFKRGESAAILSIVSRVLSLMSSTMFSNRFLARSRASSPSTVIVQYSLEKKNSLRLLIVSTSPFSISSVINGETIRVSSLTILAIFFSVRDWPFMQFSIWISRLLSSSTRSSSWCCCCFSFHSVLTSLLLCPIIIYPHIIFFLIVWLYLQRLLTFPLHCLYYIPVKALLPLHLHKLCYCKS